MPVVNFIESEYLLPYLKQQIGEKSHYHNTMLANNFLAILNYNTSYNIT